MQTFDTPDPILATVELGVGDIRIVASDRIDTVVDVRPSDPAKKGDVAAAEQTRVEYASGRLLIRAPKGWRRWTPFGGGESIDVEIGLPTGSQVSGETGVATLRCRGRLGECRYKVGVGDIQLEHAGPVHLRTGAGEISVEQAVGRAEISTGSGTVSIERIEGAGVIRNGNGDTRIGAVTGDLRVNAANGKIDIETAHASVAAKSSNGQVRIGQVMRGAVVAQTAMGSIEVGVRDGVPAWLNLETRFGTVQNDLEPGGGPNRNEDTVEVHARTSYGDVSVQRVFATGAGMETA
jgi:hypothetical protein